MKLLLCVASLADIEPFLQSYPASLQPSPAASFLHYTKILQHEVTILETGIGLHQTTYKVTKAVTQQKYHLALKVSLGNAYKEELEVGTIVNIINEKPGDFGMIIDKEWKDHYDLGLTKREDAPHVRGGFINLNTSYMNVFAPFKKVVGVTVNHYANQEGYRLKTEKYNAHCETGDGLGFVYPCLFERQSFYHLCVIENNLATGKKDFAIASKAMNETLIDLLGKL
jgi:hypothetical protein